MDLNGTIRVEKDRIFVWAVEKAFWRPVQSVSFCVARVGKWEFFKGEGSFLGEYGKSLSKKDIFWSPVLSTQIKKSFRTWEVLDCETEDVNACDGE